MINNIRENLNSIIRNPITRQGLLAAAGGAVYAVLAHAPIKSVMASCFIWRVTETALLALEGKEGKFQIKDIKALLGFKLLVEVSITAMGLSILGKYNIIGKTMQGFIWGFRTATWIIATHAVNKQLKLN